MAIIFARLDIGNSPTRLTFLRNRALNKNTDWRSVRHTNFRTAHGALDQGFDGDVPVWYCHSGEQFRNERDAQCVEGARIDHTGWYADMHGDVLIIGIVGSLTHGRFIAGYRNDDTGERVYFGKVYADEIEAARDADSAAEKTADTEREYSERWNEASELAEHIGYKSRDVRRMFKLRHTDGFDSAADYRELEEAIDKLRELKERMVNDYSDVGI